MKAFVVRFNCGTSTKNGHNTKVKDALSTEQSPGRYATSYQVVVKITKAAHIRSYM